MVLPVGSLDADEQGAVCFYLKITVFVSYSYNIEGDIISDPQVQVKEWLRSVDH